MELSRLIESRRAYRSLEPVEIKEDVINSLVESTRLAPSCFNNQPWRYVFVYDSETLEKMHEVLSAGNEWARFASMMVVVFTKKDLDCVIREREYFLFDTGMATAFMILKATEMGLVAHPIAGFSPKKVRRILEIPDDYNVIALIIMGKHSDVMNPLMSEKQVSAESERPERMISGEFACHNRFCLVAEVDKKELA